MQMHLNKINNNNFFTGINKTDSSTMDKTMQVHKVSDEEVSNSIAEMFLSTEAYEIINEVTTNKKKANHLDNPKRPAFTIEQRQSLSPENKDSNQHSV